MDAVEILKVPIDYDVKKIGFILLDEDSEDLDMEIDLDLTPKQEKAKSKDKIEKNQCDECERIYTNASNLKRHKKTIHDNARLECQICNVKFETKLKLTLHMKKHIYLKACDVCGVDINSQLDMEEHMNEHQAIDMDADEIYDMIV